MEQMSVVQLDLADRAAPSSPSVEGRSGIDPHAAIASAHHSALARLVYRVRRKRDVLLCFEHRQALGQCSADRVVGTAAKRQA
jgi:hypothetical protein